MWGNLFAPPPIPHLPSVSSPKKTILDRVKTKSNSNFAVNLPEMLKEATIHFCLFDESHFSNIYTL